MCILYIKFTLNSNLYRRRKKYIANTNKLRIYYSDTHIVYIYIHARRL